MANRIYTLSDLTHNLNEEWGMQFSEKTVFRKLHKESYRGNVQRKRWWCGVKTEKNVG
jgi:hypothetical protein